MALQSHLRCRWWRQKALPLQNTNRGFTRFFLHTNSYSYCTNTQISMPKHSYVKFFLIFIFYIFLIVILFLFQLLKKELERFIVIVCRGWGVNLYSYYTVLSTWSYYRINNYYANPVFLPNKMFYLYLHWNCSYLCRLFCF